MWFFLVVNRASLNEYPAIVSTKTMSRNSGYHTAWLAVCESTVPSFRLYALGVYS